MLRLQEINGLFISQEAEDYFDKLPVKDKRYLRVFIHQIQSCEEIDTPDAKNSLQRTIQRWNSARDNPYLAQLFKHLDRYMDNKLFLPGDLSRCYVQILDALSKN